jgi:hypothetical protein
MGVQLDEARAIASEVLWMTRLRLSPVRGGCGDVIPAVESLRVIGEGLVERYLPESGIKCGQAYNTLLGDEVRYHMCEKCWQKLRSEIVPPER